MKRVGGLLSLPPADPRSTLLLLSLGPRRLHFNGFHPCRLVLASAMGRHWQELGGWEDSGMGVIFRALAVSAYKDHSP